MFFATTPDLQTESYRVSEKTCFFPFVLALRYGTAWTPYVALRHGMLRYGMLEIGLNVSVDQVTQVMSTPWIKSR